jgi:hypothetical protein
MSVFREVSVGEAGENFEGVLPWAASVDGVEKNAENCRIGFGRARARRPDSIGEGGGGDGDGPGCDGDQVLETG